LLQYVGATRRSKLGGALSGFEKNEGIMEIFIIDVKVLLT
jgi:hypothetical protein